MANINEIFVKVLNEGIQSANVISDPKDKSIAYAELAKAIAMTGLVSIGDKSEEIDVTEAKEALREKAKPAKTKAKKQEAEPEQQQEKASEEASNHQVQEESSEKETTEITEEWTEEMIEMFKEQLDFIRGLQEEYDEEIIDECVRNFSEGQFNSIDDITPLNIEGFAAYMKMLIEDAEQSEEE